MMMGTGLILGPMGFDGWGIELGAPRDNQVVFRRETSRLSPLMASMLCHIAPGTLEAGSKSAITVLVQE